MDERGQGALGDRLRLVSFLPARARTPEDHANSDTRRACEKRINAFPNFTAQVTDPKYPDETTTIHFIALFSQSPSAVPITLLHGWPGSIIEFLDLLAVVKKQYPDPTTLPYHIIVPSLPGYGYSSGPPRTRNYTLLDLGRMINALMVGLGFGDGYIAQGGDIGSRTARVLAGFHESCKALHINFNIMPEPPGLDPASNPADVVTPEEQRGLETRHKQFITDGIAYVREHHTRPSTIGFALSASPLALLAWVGEKFVAWSDVTPPLTEILDAVTLYWFTQSFPRSIYPYRDREQSPHDPFSKDSPYHIGSKPLGYSWFPMELGPMPVAWVRRTGNLVWYKRHEAGGHFAAMERPADLWADIESFVAQVKPNIVLSKL